MEKFSVISFVREWNNKRQSKYMLYTAHMTDANRHGRNNVEKPL